MIVSSPNYSFSEGETVTETEEEQLCNGYLVPPPADVNTTALGIKNTSDIAEQPSTWKSTAERAIANGWSNFSHWFAIIWLDFRDGAKKVRLY